eukprot:1617042-Amphidinium_carterae.1
MKRWSAWTSSWACVKLRCSLAMRVMRSKSWGPTTARAHLGLRWTWPRDRKALSHQLHTDRRRQACVMSHHGGSLKALCINA